MSGSQSNDNLPAEQPKGQFLVYQAEDGKVKLEVRLEDETVWLSQRLMAELFQKDIRTISEHIQNIYDEGELVPEATIRKFRIVQTEGSREVTRMVDHYNLDMIISVGYDLGSDGRHLVPNQAEQKTVRLICALNQKGKSYRAICRELERKRIPAKRGGRRWYPQTVKSILEMKQLTPFSASQP